MRNGGGGAQMGKRRLMKYSRALPHECLHPKSSSRAEAACHVTLFLKIATASMSREIFLVNDYDGVFKERFESNIESWGPAAVPQIH